MKTKQSPEAQSIIQKIQSLAEPGGVEGLARFGIVTKKACGVRTPLLKKLAKTIEKNHSLAHELWNTGIFDARIIALLIEEPEKVTEQQVDEWTNDFDSWAICDGTCLYLYHKTPYAWKKIFTWYKQKPEYVKRAGFALMAVLAIHDKKSPDSKFETLFPLIKQGATDERNFVRKAVNWALRQIGKRNSFLHKKAVEAAKEIQKIDSKSARWVAADALRELQSDAVKTRLKKKEK